MAEWLNVSVLKTENSKGFVSSNLTVSSSLLWGFMKRIWSLWAKALGDKQGKTDSDADVIALIRTLIVLIYLTTNIFIIAGIIRHW